jgi:hypothetical protein
VFEKEWLRFEDEWQLNERKQKLFGDGLRVR